MVARPVPEVFKVAFSLAGEQREFVRAIAEAVEARLGAPSVFLDEWFEHYIAGVDADLKLQQIYGKRSVLAVVCVSGNYNDKPWTQAEHRAIRARHMDATDDRSRLAILPIRVGEGDVDGIPSNSIVVDIRGRSAAQAADLILDRLAEIENPGLATPASSAQWPELPPELSWPMANHSEVRAGFEQLLTQKSKWRILLVQGPSESGKSHISHQMLGNALRMQDLTCGRFDFKGTTDMDAELSAFIQQLELPVSVHAGSLNQRLGALLDELKRRRRPALLIFDTYEASGEARAWMEKQLLPAVIRCAWLRVVVTGQSVPARTNAIWESNTAPVITLTAPQPADWLEFARPHHPEITLELVEAFCKHAAYKASLLQQLLGPRS